MFKINLVSKNIDSVKIDSWGRSNWKEKSNNIVIDCPITSILLVYFEIW